MKTINLSRSLSRTYIYMDPNLYEAAVKGKFKPFEDIAKDVIKSLVTLTKNTILHINIIAQDEVSTTTKFVEEILEICPSLLLKANAKGDTPLHVAAKCGHVDIVRVLIERAKSQHVELETWVGAARQMIRMENSEKNTALHQAVRHGRLDIVKILMKEEPNFPYSANLYLETPLYMAAMKRSSEIVAEILENCPSAAHQGPNEKTALHAAVISGSLDLIKQIFEKKQSLIRESDCFGWTPIHYAAYSGCKHTVKLFLEFDRSAAYIADTYRDRTALHLAAAQGHADIVDLIISYCPECYEQVDDSDWNVLHFAMVSFSAEELKILLKNPFVRNLINEKDDEGNTPLHVLAAFCRELSSDIVTYKSGGDYQAVNRENMSVEDVISDDSCQLKREIQNWSNLAGRSGKYPYGLFRITEQKWENQSEEIRSFSKELDEYAIGIKEE